jgi:hypothetical protein
MNNFLRHLLQRSLAPSATLQPRLASRFESNAGPVRPPTELTIETETATPGAPAPLPAVPVLAAQSAATRSESAQSASPLASMPAPPPPAQPPAFAPSRPLAVQPVLPDATPAPAAPPPPVAPLATPSTSGAREIFSMPPASSGTLLIEHVTERIRESYPVPGSSLPTAVPASPIAASALAPAPPAPRTTPASPSTAPVARPIVAPAAAPIIRVTIGRVDIRAIHPAPPAPVRVSAPDRRPLVSLETYLKQRNAK